MRFIHVGVKFLSLALKDTQRLRVFENSVLRGVFGTERVGVTG